MHRQTYATTRRAIAATVAALALHGLAADLTIDTPTTVSTDSGSVDNLYVRDILTITSGGKLQVSKGATFGAEDGDVAGFVVNGPGNFSTGGGVRMTFGKSLADPAVDLDGVGWGRIYTYNMDIAANAATSGDEIHFMRLRNHPNAIASFMEMKNLNTKPAVVLFEKGGLAMSHSGKSGFVLPSSGNRIVLRSVESNPIRLLFSSWTANTSWQMPYSANAGTLETQGSGDVVFSGATGVATQGGTVFFNIPYDDGRLAWNHTGDFVFTNAIVKTTVDNALPYSDTAPRTLRFGLVEGTSVSATQYSGIDLNGHSSKVGNLYMGEGTFVTNSAATEGTLVLGADGQRSIFSGTTRGNVIVECVSGDYEIASGSNVAKLRADALPVNLASGAVVHEIEAMHTTDAVSTFIDAGDVVDITGLRAEPLWTWDRSYTNYYNGQTYSGGQRMNGGMPFVLGETGLSNGLHHVVVAASGTAVANVSEDCEFKYLKVSGEGSFKKIGAGQATLVGNRRLSVGRTEVIAGTLALQGAGCTNEWYRLTVTHEYGSHDYVTFGKIGLFGETGKWLCLGSSFQPSKTEAELLPGECTVGQGLTYDNDNAKSKYYPGHLFVADYAYYGAKFTNRSSSSPAITITFRLPTASAPALWHSIGAVGNRGDNPCGWKLETSANGVDGWTEVVSVDQDLITNAEKYYYWRNDRRYNDMPWNSSGTQKSEGLPWRLSLNNAIAIGNTLGVVRVDSGATLNLTGSDGAGISGLEIDLSVGGGTIRGLAIPANGTLALVNVPSGTNLYGPVLIALDSATGTANFKNWNVTVNGRTKDCRIQIDANGALTLAAEATVIFMR